MSPLALALLLLPADPPAAADLHDPPPPGAAAAVGSTRLRVGGESARLSADGTTVVSTADGAVVALDPATGKVTARIPIPASLPAVIDYDSKTGRAVVLGHPGPPDQGHTLERAAWVVDVPGGKVVRSITISTDDVLQQGWRFAVSADHARLVVLYQTGGVTAWDLGTGEQAGECPTPRRTLDELAVSPDGQRVAVRVPGGDVLVGDVGPPGEPREPPRPVQVKADQVTFGPDGKTLYAVSGGRVVAVDVVTGKPSGGFDIRPGPRVVALRPDGKVFAAGYHTEPGVVPEVRGVVLWEVATGKELARLPTGRGYVNSVSWSADGARVAAVAGDRVWVFDAVTGRPVTPPPAGHDGLIHQVAFGADGRLFTGGSDGTVRWWDPQTGRPGPPLLFPDRVGAVGVSADGSHVAGGWAGADLRIWDGQTGALRHTLAADGRATGPWAVGFRPDGKRLVAWGRGCGLRTVDPATGEVLAEHAVLADVGRDTPIPAYALSPDAAVLAVALRGEVRLFDAATGKERPSLTAGLGGASQLAFSPDGRRLAVMVNRRGPADAHPLAVWDLSTVKPVWRATPPGAGSIGDSLAYSPDGGRVVELVNSAEKGRALQVRDAVTGADLGRVPVAAFVGGRSGLAVSPDGRRAAVALRNGTVAIYELPAARPAK